MALGWLLTAAAAASVAGADLQRFDLVCHGTVYSDRLVRRGHGFQFRPGSFGRPFRTVIQIDLQGRRFCDEDACAPLAYANARLLGFDCQAREGEGFCAPFSSSTAGPFIDLDRFEFDRKTRRFVRTTAGEEGDIVSMPFREEYEGVCAIEPSSRPLKEPEPPGR